MPHYGHAKQKGLVLSAAMLMFLEADPSEQGKALERIMIADVRNGVDTLIERAELSRSNASTHAARPILPRAPRPSPPDSEPPRQPANPRRASRI